MLHEGTKMTKEEFEKTLLARVQREVLKRNGKDGLILFRENYSHVKGMEKENELRTKVG